MAWLYPLSLAGVLVSAYVWFSQKSGKPIVCWTRDCDRVIRSSYSRLAGVHNSAIGFWVFLVVFLVTLLRDLSPGANLLSGALILLSLVGALVSLYLTFVQIFILKGICNWCMTSAVLVLAILIITIANG